MFDTFIDTLAARMNSYWTALLRTAPVALVTALVGWATHRGLAIDDGTRDFLVYLLSALAAIAWYALWHRLELLAKHRSIPWLARLAGTLVGFPGPPIYDIQPLKTAGARAPPVQ